MELARMLGYAAPILSLAALSACAVQAQIPPAPVIEPTRAGDPALVRLTGCSGRKCVVEITVNGDCTSKANVVVTPETLDMGVKDPKIIVWRLPAGHGFCPVLGDGVYLQPSTQGNFTGTGTTDHDDGDANNEDDSKCRRRFRTFNYNWGTSKYLYYLQFTQVVNVPGSTPTIRTCKIDPWIKNGQ